MDQDDEGLDTLADKALALRLRGSSWESIAGRLNLPANLVSTMVADRLLDTPAVEHEVEIRLDLARLDALLVPAYRNGTKGDAKSIDQALKILARRGELLSDLDAAPPAGVGLDQLNDDDDDAEDRAPASLSPADRLARIRDTAASSVSGATVFRIVQDDEEDDDE